MKISEIYQLTPQSTTFELTDFVLHIEEFEYLSGWIGHDSRIVNQKIEIKILWYQDFDRNSYWQLATAWFDGKPFGVIQNAGRHGEGHVKAFWTDIDLYFQSVRYIRSILPVEEIPELTDLSFDAPELLKFHELSYKKEYFRTCWY